MSTYDFYLRDLDPTPRTRKVSGPFGAGESLKSVAEAVRFCERKGLDPEQVGLAHNFVTWETTETPDEVQARIDRTKDGLDRHLAAIKAMHSEYVDRGLYEEGE